MVSEADRGVLRDLVKFEKVEYKPIPVRDLLIEIKDYSELMIDLAYSAALFDSKELAREVLELEERVDTLAYLLNMNVMIAVRDAQDAESLVGVSAVASAADKISDAAADIASLVIQNIGIHPLVREAFEKTEERLKRIMVKPASTLAGSTLENLELAARMGVDIIAIRRKRRWLINPEKTEKIEEDDVLIVRGAPHGVVELQSLADGATARWEE